MEQALGIYAALAALTWLVLDLAWQKHAETGPWSSVTPYWVTLVGAALWPASWLWIACRLIGGKQR